MIIKNHIRVTSMLFRNHRNCCVICFILCLWMILGAGCRFPWPTQPKTVDSSLSPAAIKAYRAAEDKFRAGDYAESAKRFSAIRDQASDKRLARMALYGLALSQLVAAETPEAYERALSLWRNWVNIAPEAVEHEDAVLFDTLVREKMLFSNIPTASDKAEKAEKTDTDRAVPNWLFVRTKQEMDRLREQLEGYEAKLKKQQARNQALEKEIGRLKRQIKAMETIDQKIQEKKNAIPAAD